MQNWINGTPMVELLMTMGIISWVLLTVWKCVQQAQLVKIQADMRDRYTFNANTQLNHDVMNRLTDELTVRLNKLSERTIVAWERDLTQKEAELAEREASLKSQSPGQVS